MTILLTFLQQALQSKLIRITTQHCLGFPDMERSVKCVVKKTRDFEITRKIII